MFSGERFYHYRDVFRRYPGHADLLQGRCQPWRRIYRAERGEGAGIPDHLQHGGQDGDVVGRVEARFSESARQVGHQFIQRIQKYLG